MKKLMVKYIMLAIIAPIYTNLWVMMDSLDVCDQCVCLQLELDMFRVREIERATRLLFYWC
jgi:hypothetical protein